MRWHKERIAKMSKYRKKSVVVEAWQFDGSMSSAENIAALDDRMSVLSSTEEPPEVYIIINTLEGRMTANPHDWIIRGVAGELYPCKPDIFAATYDPV